MKRSKLSKDYIEDSDAEADGTAPALNSIEEDQEESPSLEKNSEGEHFLKVHIS